MLSQKTNRLVPATVTLDGLGDFPAFIERDADGVPVEAAPGGFLVPLFDHRTMLEVVEWAGDALDFEDGGSIAYDAVRDMVVETDGPDIFTSSPDGRGLYRVGTDWIWSEKRP